MPPINLNNATTTYTKITSSATAQVLAAENGRREGLMIHNASTSNLYIRIDSDASTTDFMTVLPPNSFYEMPASYFTDYVSGIWSSANGFATVTEISK